MDISKLIEEMGRVDGPGSESISPRRSAIKNFLQFGKRASLAALPVALGSVFQIASAQTTGSQEVEALNLLLALEYAQHVFYNYALTSTTIIPTAAVPAITTLRDQQKTHIDFLIGRITASGGIPRTPLVYTDFDYRIIATRNATTGVPATYQLGTAAIMNDYKLFLRSAMILEDLSCRVYKGQLVSFINNKALLSAVAQMHSLEARHSAEIRQLIVNAVINNPANLQYLRPWVSYRRDVNGFTGAASTPPVYTANDSGVTGLNSYYDYDTTTTLLNRETKTQQAGIETIAIGGLTEVTLPYAAESFDEYVLAPFAKTLLNNFIIQSANFLR